MEIILLKNIERLGKANSVVKVKKGYGQHYLIPQGLALVASLANRKVADAAEKLRVHKALKVKEAAQKMAKQVANLRLNLKVEAAKEGKLFGMVNKRALVEAFSVQNLQIKEKQITFPKPIEAIGQWPIILTLHPEVEVTIQIMVKGKGK